MLSHGKCFGDTQREEVWEQQPKPIHAEATWLFFILSQLGCFLMSWPQHTGCWNPREWIAKNMSDIFFDIQRPFVRLDLT